MCVYPTWQRSKQKRFPLGFGRRRSFGSYTYSFNYTYNSIVSRCMERNAFPDSPISKSHVFYPATFSNMYTRPFSRGCDVRRLCIGGERAARARVVAVMKMLMVQYTCSPMKGPGVMPSTLQSLSQSELQIPFRPPISPLIKLHRSRHLSPITQLQTREVIARPRVQLPFPWRCAVVCRSGHAPRFHACRLSRV